MASEAHMIGYELLKTGALVSFRIVEEVVLEAPDEAEFGIGRSVDILYILKRRT